MKQAIYGLILYVFLILPPVATLMVSICVVHMLFLLSLLVISGILMARFFQVRFPDFFEKWNRNGIPGILLFVFIWTYWLIPRAMDEALTMQMVEIFKFISLPFLAGIPLRDSWGKLGKMGKYIMFIYFIITSLALGWLYIASPEQLCNTCLVVEQRALGWSSAIIGICVMLYFVQDIFVDESEYE